MKKIFTLFMFVGAGISAFAQTSAEEARRIILGRKSGSTSGTDNRDRDVVLGRDGRTTDDNRNTQYPSGTREQQIDQVNREYDNKIQSVRNNPTLTAAEKERMIRQLNNDRARRIKEINGRSQNRKADKNREYDRDDRDDDDDDKYKKDKKQKGNNGNHYGWEKGKGNPHKNGGKPGKGNSGGKGKGKG